MSTSGRGLDYAQQYDPQLQQEREEREAREALEVERLQQLRDAQISPSDYHGYDLPDYRYSGTDYSFQPEPSYYRPPTGYDYETDTPQITYYDMFGEPSLADQDKFQAEFEELLGSENTWSEAERQQIEEKRNSFLAGEIDPWSMNVQNMYAEFNIKEREEIADKISDAGYEDYSLQATNLTEAKAQADEVYMDVLRNAYEENSTNELEQLIEQGPLDFNKIEDVQLYDSLSEDSIQRQAFDAQGAVVEDYLNRSDDRVFDTRMLEQGETVSLGAAGPAQFLLNTGTIIGAPTASADNVKFGEFGSYGNLAWNNPPEPSTFEKNLSLGLDILSIVYPPLAPVLQGGKVLVEGGDLKDAVKAGATVYVGGKITKELTGFTEELFTDINIDLSSLPEPVKQTLVDTTAGVIVGQDPEEALTNSIARQATDYATDWAAGEIESVTGDLGQDLKAFLGLPEDYEMPETLQNIVDDTTTAFVRGDSASDALVDSIEGEAKDVIGDFAEDTTKELLSGAEELLGDGLAAFDDAVIQPIITPIKPVLTAVEEGVKTAGRTVDEEVIQPLIEPVKPILTDIEEGIKTAGRTVDEEVIQPILEPVKKAVTAIDEALPHGTTPELPDGPDIDIDLDLPSPVVELEEPKSQVAGLFDKELGEIYKHDIYELPQLFSDKRIQGMLSRKYRV